MRKNIALIEFIAPKILIVLCCALLSCNFKNAKNEDEEDKEDQLSLSKSRTWGDTLKVTYEIHGDTIIQHRIDLKGASDDKWDATYTVKSIWSTRKTKPLKCDDRLTLTFDKIDFVFCYDDVFRKVQSDMDKNWMDSLGLADAQQDLMRYHKKEIDTLSTDMYSLTFRLVRSIDFSAFDHSSNRSIYKVRVEQFTTGFSGGHNFYLIGDKKDTIGWFDVRDWIR